MSTSKFSLSEVMNMLEDDQLQYSDDLFESNGEQSYDVNEIFDNVPNDLCDQQFSEQNETNLNTFDNVDDSISLAHNSEENLSTIPDTVTLNFYDTSRLPESEISEETCDLNTEEQANVIIVEKDEIKVYMNLDRQSTNQRNEVIYNSSMLCNDLNNNITPVSDENNNFSQGESIDDSVENLIQDSSEEPMNRNDDSVENLIQDSSGEPVNRNDDSVQQARSRKRRRDPSSCKKNIQKRRRQLRWDLCWGYENCVWVMRNLLGL
jgi:hypothetical protein